MANEEVKPDDATLLGDKPADETKPDETKPDESSATDQGKPSAQGDGDPGTETKPDGDVKPDEGKPDSEAKPDAADDKSAAKAPDTYSLTPPDGFEPDELKAFEVQARELNLTNDQAQASLDALPAALEAQTSRFKADVQKHPEIGGDKLEAATASANKALDAFLPPDTEEGKTFRRAMDASGYGNYAPLVLLLARIGKAMGEDTGLRAGAVGDQTPTDRSKRLFPSSPN